MSDANQQTAQDGANAAPADKAADAGTGVSGAGGVAGEGAGAVQTEAPTEAGPHVKGGLFGQIVTVRDANDYEHPAIVTRGPYSNARGTNLITATVFLDGGGAVGLELQPLPAGNPPPGFYWYSGT